MKITEDRKGEMLIYRLKGDVNLSNSPVLRKAFESCTQGDVKKVIVDFKEVPYIDSSGLATLIEILQRLKKIGGNLRICNLDEKVKGIFEVTRLFKLFKICDNEDMAVEDF